MYGKTGDKIVTLPQNKTCTCCAFYLPKSNFFCTASDVTPVYGVTPA